MAITTTPFVAGDAVTAAEILAQIEEPERFVNTNLEAADLAAGGWVSIDQLARPVFAGGSMPRVILQSCDVHHQETGNSFHDASPISDDVVVDEWLPIPGLWRTCDVQPPRAETTADVIVRAQFYTYEKQGTTAAGIEAALFQLGQDDFIMRPSSERRVGVESSDMLYRVHHHVETRFTGVSRGRHHFGVYVWVNDSGTIPTTRNWTHIWVKARTLIVRPVYR
mgnify:FL=1